MTDNNNSTPDETQPEEGNGGAAPLPEPKVEDTSADSKKSHETEATETAATTTEDESTSDDLQKWAESQGIDFENPTSEHMQKMAQRVRDAQFKMHEATNKSAELESGIGEAIDGATENNQITPEDARILKLEQEMAVTRFYLNNPEANKYDAKMGELVRRKPWLANDLQDLYRLARLESSGESIDKIAESARKNERDLLNQKQRAGATKPAASQKSEQQEEEDPIMLGLNSNY